MTGITASVGHNGVNKKSDVRTVQKLLNEHDLSPLKSLDVDGISGPATVAAIRHFQDKKAGMRNPDGRVDPGGRTLRDLNKSRSMPRETPERPTPESRKTNRKERRKFVRPQVKETPQTSRIIDGIEPHFRQTRAKVISGYLNDSDRFWKINYHWDYLLWMSDHSLTLAMSTSGQQKLKSIKSSLKAVAPDPDEGYRTSAKLGKPEDRSSVEKANERHRVLRSGKQQFKKIVIQENLKTKSSRGSRAFDLAGAPVAHPGTSKHGTGYALDISGNNRQIKSICKQLGATVTFDEQSHVHVEFKNGVQSKVG